MSPDLLDCISLQRSERAKKREIAENIYDPFFVSIIFGHCLFWWFGAFFLASRVTLHTLSQFEIPINEYNLHTRNFHAFVLSKRHLLFIARFEYDTFLFVRGFLHRLLLFFFLLLLCRFFYSSLQLGPYAKQRRNLLLNRNVCCGTVSHIRGSYVNRDIDNV